MITTNNQIRDILDAYDLSESERKDFDYLNWDAIEKGEDSASFFRYKGVLYDLGEFSTTSGLDGAMDLWDGYLNETFFSGIVVKMREDGIIVGRYCF